MTDRQLAIVLSALRMAQEIAPDGSVLEENFRDKPQMEEFDDPVTFEEIDELCEHLNSQRER